MPPVVKPHKTLLLLMLQKFCRGKGTEGLEKFLKIHVYFLQ
jgi:hypothetical protein